MKGGIMGLQRMIAMGCQPSWDIFVYMQRPIQPLLSNVSLILITCILVFNNS